MARPSSASIAFFLLLSSLLSCVDAQVNISALYAPTSGPCPSGFQLVRSAGAPGSQTLASDESSYISTRKSQVLPDAWKSYLANVQNKGLSLPSYVATIVNNGSTLPTLGIASSGGGYRAAIFGAGVLNALDGRNSSSVSSGTGGLLQAATYLTGLSGGSWLVTSLVQADFPSIPDLVFGPPGGPSNASLYGGWNAQLDILQPFNNTAQNIPYLLEAVQETAGKFAAGYPVTIADLWARLISRHFLNGTNANNYFGTNDTAHGAGELFSNLPTVSTFQNHEVPFPIVLANANSPGGNKSATLSGDFEPLSNVIYEFNPYEMGSYDSMLASFIPMKYLGTTGTSTCVTNFDQASFVMGTSSNIYNEYNTSTSDLLHSTVGPLFSLLNASISQPSSVELDVALIPNPFVGVNSGSYVDSNQAFLALVDGGEDGEVVPIQPLLVKARGVDVIIAIDAANDNQGFTAGGSLVATQDRVSSSAFSSAYAFPKVPSDTSTFENQNLVSRPAFFGCDDSSPTPLVIYLANGAGAVSSSSGAPMNTSTSQFMYPQTTMETMLDGVFNYAVRTEDKNWPACLACAVVDRQRAALGAKRDGVCGKCFDSYCWRGKKLGNSGRSNRLGAAGLGSLAAVSGLLSIFVLLL